ncbi:aldose 1-epimerase [Sporothrix schenckii 1099-18]|uniref:Aldose 1-epimerase n=1 Tax=Sporothrix schenckii 1099-18 TaxID=1397361 RepID=A0A0F2M8D7_SPOSC|nr:aldose 1-epimerase [Sporothrix schenckii 1099-18]KJR85075.1 aldose 1-epimerase [Sporothrix schenckii 1099-18]
MRSTLFLALPGLAGLALAVRRDGVPAPAADGRYTITADGIKAQFIPYGATLTNLWVKDRHGNDTDVVLGYDDAAYYPKDPGHPVYNSIPGRYVSRIGNATYTLDGKTYATEKNDGANTLHSGTNNWSYRVWNVTAVGASSITFAIYDKAGSEQGLPGDVTANVTYTLTAGRLGIVMWASADARTPLMLTHHTYFNLDAYKNTASPKIWDHTLYLPYSQRYLEGDDGAVPTGRILTAAPGAVNDFASAANLTLGHAQADPKFAGNCGGGGQCEGYNGYFLAENVPSGDSVVARLAAPFAGIAAELRTNQPGVTVYTCNWMDGTAPLKSTQGTANVTKVGRSSCVAIEAHDYPNAINHPEWNRTKYEIANPGTPYFWNSSWTFSTFK